MNTKHIRQFLFGAIFSLLVMPTMGFSHEVADPLHSTPVETLDSRLAYPAEIHVQAIGQRLEIKGILKSVRQGIKHKAFVVMWMWK